MSWPRPPDGVRRQGAAERSKARNLNGVAEEKAKRVGVGRESDLSTGRGESQGAPTNTAAGQAPSTPLLIMKLLISLYD